MANIKLKKLYKFDEYIIVGETVEVDETEAESLVDDDEYVVAEYHRGVLPSQIKAGNAVKAYKKNFNKDGTPKDKPETPAPPVDPGPPEEPGAPGKGKDKEPEPEPEPTP